MNTPLFNIDRYTKRKVTTKANCRRNEMIEIFMKRLNEARKGTSYKILTFVSLVGILSHVPTADLEVFLASCKQAGNFSSYFWHCLK